MKVNHVIVAIFYVANMSFNALCENKILAKISEFTVIFVRFPKVRVSKLYLSFIEETVNQYKPK